MTDHFTDNSLVDLFAYKQKELENYTQMLSNRVDSLYFYYYCVCYCGFIDACLTHPPFLTCSLSFFLPEKFKKGLLSEWKRITFQMEEAENILGLVKIMRKYRLNLFVE